MFNIDRYKGKKIHENPQINKKIIALFLLFDKKVSDCNYGYKESILLINKYIDDLIQFEEYEAVLAFRSRKFKKMKKWRKKRRGSISFEMRIRLIKFKIRRFINPI